MNNEIIQMKSRIIEENINNIGLRRKFSPQIKKDVVDKYLLEEIRVDRGIRPTYDLYINCIAYINDNRM